MASIKNAIKDHAIALLKASQKLSDIHNDIEREFGLYENVVSQLRDRLKTCGDIRSLKDENEALKKRLCEMMSSRVHDNNPDIVDLGDANRASTVAGKMDQLYTDEWVDAFESLAETRPDLDGRGRIDVLLALMVRSFYECRELRDGMLRALVLGADPSNVPSQLLLTCKKVIKSLGPTVVKGDNIYNSVAEQLLKTNAGIQTLLEIPEVKRYFKIAVELSWYFAIQIPPCDIVVPEHGARYDTGIMIFYEQSGDKIDYAVWPVLLLNKNGPVLNRGVVQCIKGVKKCN